MLGNFPPFFQRGRRRGRHHLRARVNVKNHERPKNDFKTRVIVGFTYKLRWLIQKVPSLFFCEQFFCFLSIFCVGKITKNFWFFFFLFLFFIFILDKITFLLSFFPLKETFGDSLLFFFFSLFQPIPPSTLTKHS